MKCPQCGAETPANEWNCVSCRMNLYWASQHYDDLADIRERQGLPGGASPPPFLVAAHREAMDDRAERGGRVEHRVRVIARRVMRKQAVKRTTPSRQLTEAGPVQRPLSSGADLTLPEQPFEIRPKADSE
jgi:hypothetical protein